MGKPRISIPTLFFAAGVCFLWGCASGPLRDETDPEVKLTKYHSYRWLSDDEARTLKLDAPKVDYFTDSITVDRDNELDGRVHQAMDRQLQATGYRAVSEGKPDFYVSYYVKQPDDTWLSSWRGITSAINETPVVIFPDFDRSKISTYRKGQVYLVFYDARTRRPAWTGIAMSQAFGPAEDLSKVEPIIASLMGEYRDEVKATA